MDHNYRHKIIKYNTWCSVKFLENYSTRLDHLFKKISLDNFRDCFKPSPFPLRGGANMEKNIPKVSIQSSTLC